MQFSSAAVLFGKGGGIKKPDSKTKIAVDKKRILVAPLNWGLGHATRCIPIIRELIANNIDVAIAADGRPYDLLRKEFPSLRFYRLPGFAPTYSKKGATPFHIIKQMPALVKATFAEHRTLQEIIEMENISAVVSDSRFGLFTKKIPTVYVVHQIRILLPKRLQWLELLLYYLHRLIITRFMECWIPDYSVAQNLSGKLAHSFPLPSNAKFIGPLTRFTKTKALEKKRNILVILSGPEPQRTVFEKIIIKQLLQSEFTALIVRGIPEAEEHLSLSQKVSSVSTIPAEQINDEILASEIILSRPGYSTIMDLAVLGKKAIFVPTPGQTEQEYLAQFFHRQKICFAMQQSEFNLNFAMNAVCQYTGFAQAKEPTHLTDAVVNFLSRIQAQ